MAVVEDHKIGDQMIVFDNLQLIVANIFGDGTLCATDGKRNSFSVLMQSVRFFYTLEIGIPDCE